MKCPECKSEHVRKNGIRRGKQNHICVNCDRQFVENPKNDRGYSDEIRKMCFNSVVGYAELNSASPTLKMYLNGMGFRGIERVTGVHHTTVINWVKQVGELLPDAYDPETTPEVGELDELETFVGSKKTKFGSGPQ